MVNGGFFVCEKDIFDYLNDGDKTIFEREPLENLASTLNFIVFIMMVFGNVWTH